MQAIEEELEFDTPLEEEVRQTFKRDEIAYLRIREILKLSPFTTSRSEGNSLSKRIFNASSYGTLKNLAGSLSPLSWIFPCPSFISHKKKTEMST
jgi:hypothetical protein